MRRSIVQFLKGLSYIVPYVGANIAVTIIAMLVIGAQEGIRMIPSEEGIEFGILINRAIESAIEKTIENASLISLITGILATAIIIIAFLLRKEDFFAGVGMRKIKASIIAPLLFLGVGANLLLSVLLEILPIPEDLMASYGEQAGLLTRGNIIIDVLAIAIMAPLVEEIIFRGLVLDRFHKGMSPMVAIILSSLIFSVFHGHIVWASYTFVLGIILGVLYLRTKSLISSILVHFAFNAYAAMLLVFNVEEIPEIFNIPMLGIGIVFTVCSLIIIMKLTKDKGKLVEMV